LALAGGGFEALPHQGEALSRETEFGAGVGEVVLQPGSRLVLVSDGFVEVAGGASETRELLNRFRGREPLDGLNEFVFEVKKKFEEPDDLPAQDCTAIALDMDANVLRLASRE
jgi:hypothetical protein